MAGRTVCCWPYLQVSFRFTTAHYAPQMCKWQHKGMHRGSTLRLWHPALKYMALLRKDPLGQTKPMAVVSVWWLASRLKKQTCFVFWFQATPVYFYLFYLQMLLWGKESAMTDVEPLVTDFAASGRAGRRNALPDILGSPAGAGTSDLPHKLAELSISEGSTCVFQKRESAHSHPLLSP